jgi:predicted transcriptional regulator
MLTTTTSKGLRQRREALGMTRTRVAAAAGFSPAHLAQLEDGYVPRRGDALERIKRVLAAHEVAQAQADN